MHTPPPPHEMQRTAYAGVASTLQTQTILTLILLLPHWLPRWLLQDWLQPLWRQHVWPQHLQHHYRPRLEHTLPSKCCDGNSQCGNSQCTFALQSATTRNQLTSQRLHERTKRLNCIVPGNTVTTIPPACKADLMHLDLAIANYTVF